jgi:hypothetical protein
MNWENKKNNISGSTLQPTGPFSSGFNQRRDLLYIERSKGAD